VLAVKMEAMVVAVAVLCCGVVVVLVVMELTGWWTGSS